MQVPSEVGKPERPGGQSVTHLTWKGDLKLRELTALMLLLACFASATSKLPVSPPFVGLALILALIQYSKGSIAAPSYTQWCAIYFVFITGSMLLSGIPASVFLNFDLYRYDGNVYVSFLPFLIAPAVVDHRLPPRVSLVLLVLGAGTFVSLVEIIHPGALFKSHNALGGFISVVLMINLFMLRNPLMWIPLVCNIGVLALSDSRGSILGALASAGVILLYTRGWKKTAIAGIFAAILGSLALAGFGYRVWVSMGKPVIMNITYFSQGEKLAKGIDTGAVTVSSVAKFGGRGATIAHRIFFIWPAAVDDFLASPLVGVGFTRFDDRPQKLEGIHGVLMINRSSHILHTNLHAHNSYLQVLSETGLLGMALVTGLIVSLWISADSLKPRYRDIVRAILVYILMSSCTEQRLTTPAQMIPGASILVLLLTSRFARLRSNDVLVEKGE